MGDLFLSSTGTIADATWQTIGLAALYIAIFLLISWYAFRRSQIVESG